MRNPILCYLIVTGLSCILLFLYGFFPVKKYDGSVSTWRNMPNSIADTRLNVSELYEPSVGRVVIMVIDALRWDFVAGSDGSQNMPYIKSLLEVRRACLLTGKARPPTVTMPRIKAMTTGTVPNFVDVALNLGSSKVVEDNLLLQAQNSGKKLIFYGDETWLKLFPDTFTRSEGTTSFFVSDFTEVDDNVTRNLATELSAADWDIMVLHYLGLDHIGHVEGPQSPLVRPKLQQMDRIVKRIHRRFVQWDRDNSQPSLLIVCGDHGMKNSGSHGGASQEEVLVPLVVIGQVCSGIRASTLTEDAVPQIDLVPTLSVLLGLPIPAANLGKLIPQLLKYMPVSRQLYALYYNCRQVAAQFKKNVASALTQDSYLLYQEAMKLHNEWINSSDADLSVRVTALYQSALAGMSAKLADALVTYDMPCLVVASAVLWQIVLVLVLELQPRAARVLIVFVVNLSLLLASLLWCSMSESSSALCSLTLVSAPVLMLVLVAVALNMHLIASCVFPIGALFKMSRMTRSQTLLILGTVVQVVCLASSSLIEEEHQVWYFLWLTFVLVTLYEAMSTKFMWCLVALPFLHRVLRKWNQTGDKWASLPDIGDWLLMQDNRTYMSFILFLGLFGVWECCNHLTMRRWRSIDSMLYFAASFCIYCYRCAVGTVDFPFSFPQSRGVREVRVFWSVLTLLLTMGLGEILFELKMRRQNDMLILGSLLSTFTCCWILLCALLHRAHNVILLTAHVFMSECLYARSKETWWLVATHVWIGNVIYFYQGNSNSLASVDIASGYVGQEGYNSLIVGSLLLINTYSAPVLSYFLLISKLISSNLEKEQKRCEQELTDANRLVILMRFLPLTVYTTLLIAQRYHLFVWTVFSPKFLYESVYTCVVSCLVVLTTFLARTVLT